MTRAVPETPAAILRQLHVQTESTQRQLCRRIEASAEGTGNIYLPRGGLIQCFEGPALSWHKRTMQARQLGRRWTIAVRALTTLLTRHRKTAGPTRHGLCHSYCITLAVWRASCMTVTGQSYLILWHSHKRLSTKILICLVYFTTLSSLYAQLLNCPITGGVLEVCW